MDYALNMGWERGLTFRFKTPKGDRNWSYHEEFIPILQRTHGLWVLRNGLRRIGTLRSPMEEPPFRR